MRLAGGGGQEEEEEWPPQGEDDCSDFSYDSEGFLKVAGDGACPDGQGDVRLRGSGAGVFYGRGSKHNSVIPNKKPAQGAQRGEVRAALRWALWAWSKTVYITDSQQVKRGIEAILQGKKRRQKSHRDLWKRIAAALKAKGLANHKVEKVKAHQRKQRKEMETAEEASKRRRNEEADKRAVEAAARNSPPSQLAERRKKVVQTGRKIQDIMLKILEKRGQLMKAWVQDGSKDVSAHRMREARRNDPKINELITKELAERGTDEPERFAIEELAGDRKTVSPSHTWEPRAGSGTTPYQEMDEPAALTRDEWPHGDSLWKPLFWYWRTVQ